MDRKQFVVQFFILVCTIGAICLCSIRVYRYGLNNDSTLVDYQQFTEIKDYFFPTVSFCLCNLFLEDRLAVYGFNKSTYLEFLILSTVLDNKCEIQSDSWGHLFVDNLCMTHNPHSTAACFTFTFYRPV